MAYLRAISLVTDESHVLISLVCQLLAQLRGFDTNIWAGMVHDLLRLINQ